MGRFVAGAGVALLLTSAGLFWWQGQANDSPLPPAPAMRSSNVLPEALPEGDENMMGAALPMPSEATQQSREQRRFARYDRNRDNVITRTEMLGSRVKAFKKLDVDGNNLLSFEEWAVATSERFANADKNRDGKLDPAEFSTTAPKPKPKDKCKC